MEDNIEIPQKSENRSSILPSDLTPGNYPNEKKSACERTICIPMFMAAKFQIAKRET